MPRKIGIVDSDMSRRSAMARQIFECGLHCEPFEDLEELTAQMFSLDLVMAFDDPDTVSKIHETLQRAPDWMPVVLYGAAPCAREVVDALHGGAIDYLEWPANFEEVRTRLNRILEQRSSYARMLAQAFASRQMAGNLTPRERQILGLMRHGQTNKAMARTLGISPRTVEIHRSNMMARLNLAHSAEAVRLAVYAELSGALPGDEGSVTEEAER